MNKYILVGFLGLLFSINAFAKDELVTIDGKNITVTDFDESFLSSSKKHKSSEFNNGVYIIATCICMDNPRFKNAEKAIATVFKKHGIKIADNLKDSSKKISFTTGVSLDIGRADRQAANSFMPNHGQVASMSGQIAGAAMSGGAGGLVGFAIGALWNTDSKLLIQGNVVDSSNQDDWQLHSATIFYNLEKGKEATDDVVLKMAVEQWIKHYVVFDTPEVPIVDPLTEPTEAIATATATPEAVAFPEEIISDCPDCPQMTVIHAGSFDMGSNINDSEKPLHRVTIDKPFAIGKTEVTQGQWLAIMGSNPSVIKKCGDNCPVENVSWDDIQAFVQKLNVKTGKQYRLPSESEWEYACRAGGKQEYCGSDNIDTVSWYEGNRKAGVIISPLRAHPVSTKQANAWGLFDMSGNVWEWVEDGYHPNYEGAPVDGSAWAGGDTKRVLRGGSWKDIQQGSRAAIRINLDPSADRSFNIGFRLARVL